MLTAIAASQENLGFMDLNGLNDRVTSSSTARRSGEFRGQIVQRDGSCVITGELAGRCDAAHLIPRAKGDRGNVLDHLDFLDDINILFWISKGLCEIVLI